MPKCPKCAGLLVEREDGLYQCDGCGKVFKKKAPTTPPVQAVTADESGDCEKSFAAPTDEKPVERNKITHDEVTEKAKLSQQEEIAELRARLARLEKETDGGDAVKKQPSAVLTFVKNRGKSVLFVLLILIAFVTLMTCFCGLRGIYVNVDDPDEFFSFSATGYEWYYKLDGEQVLDKGKWSKSGNSLTLKYEDEWFGEVEESYQLKDFSWSSFTLYDSFFEEDKKFERVSVIGYKDSNKKATVTFYSNGGVGGGTHSLKIGSMLSSDETPTREGYLFMGWYTTPDGWKTGEGERYVEEQRVWKDATYYANWKNAAQFTIRGDYLEQPLSFMENDNVENIFRSSLGWNTLPTGVLGVEFFDDEGNKVNSSAAPAANVTARVIYDATVNNGTLTYVNPALTSYTVPSEVSHIAATAFANSKQLEKLYIAERQSELTVANGAFDACEKLDTVSGYAAKGMRAVVDACAGIKNLIVSDGVIPTRTFENCSGLLSVTVGSGVTAVGDRAFADCTGLREIVWNTNLSSNLGQNVFANAGNEGAGVTVYFGGNATRAFNFFDTTTTSQSPNVTAVVIGDSVTSIRDSAFSGCSSLTSATIGNGVTSIGQYAFAYCSGLTSITIPDSVTSIGYCAFEGCSGLTSITIPDSVTSIGSSAFEDCSGLTSVTIGNSVTSIEYDAFYNCSGLTSITIPDSVTSIGSDAFYNCNSLTTISYTGDMQSWLGKNWHYEIMSSGRTLYIDGSKVAGAIVIPDGVQSVPSYAFYYQAGLTSITIPDSVTSIGYCAFEGCSGLTSITIPDSVTSIGNYAFSGCSGLTSVTIGNSVTSMGYWAFYGCSGLTSITIPDSVTSIGERTFYGCSGLTSITIPDSVTSIEYSAFSGCSGLTSVYYTGDVAGWCGISGLGNIMSSGRTLYIDGEKVEGAIVIPDGVQSVPSYAFYCQAGITSITIPDSVTSIGWYAFSGCTGLTSITIPDSVTSIGDDAFEDCSGLTSVYYTGDVAGWCGISGLGNIMSSGRTLYIDGNKLEGAIVIPDGITSIPSYAFAYQTGITSITIPDSVTSIGSYAFSRCSGLTSITIPDSVTSIGEGAFYNCTGLTSITIPDSVTSIGNNAFYNCSGLTSITIPDSVTSIEYSAFSGCSGLTSVTIPDSVTGIGEWAFHNCSGLTSITIPDSVTSIGDDAFEDCSGLTSIHYTGDMQSWLGKNWHDEIMSSGRTLYIDGEKVEGAIVIPDGVQSVPSYAFRGQSGITSVVIPDSVTSIGWYAFQYCRGLTSITIPDSVTSIGWYAFYGCRGLTSVTIGNSVTGIGFDAFEDCSGLTSIYYTGDMQSWLGKDWHYEIMSSGRTLYINGNKLEGAIVIPDGVESVPSYAFRGQSGITSVVIPDSVTSIGSYAFYYCSGLTSITIPDSVTNIGSSAFSGCSGLTSITIPNGVTSIGRLAFSGCSGLTSVTFENTSGWRVSEYSNSSSYTSLSRSYLSNRSTAATYLKSTYRTYYWRRV